MTLFDLNLLLKGPISNIITWRCRDSIYEFCEEGDTDIQSIAPFVTESCSSSEDSPLSLHT